MSEIVDGLRRGLYMYRSVTSVQFTGPGTRKPTRHTRAARLSDDDRSVETRDTRLERALWQHVDRRAVVKPWCRRWRQERTQRAAPPLWCPTRRALTALRSSQSSFRLCSTVVLTRRARRS